MNSKLVYLVYLERLALIEHEKETFEEEMRILRKNQEKRIDTKLHALIKLVQED